MSYSIIFSFFNLSYCQTGTKSIIVHHLHKKAAYSSNLDGHKEFASVTSQQRVDTLRSSATVDMVTAEENEVPFSSPGLSDTMEDLRAVGSGKCRLC